MLVVALLFGAISIIFDTKWGSISASTSVFSNMGWLGTSGVYSFCCGAAGLLMPSWRVQEIKSLQKLRAKNWINDDEYEAGKSVVMKEIDLQVIDLFRSWLKKTNPKGLPSTFSDHLKKARDIYAEAGNPRNPKEPRAK